MYDNNMHSERIKIHEIIFENTALSQRG